MTESFLPKIDGIVTMLLKTVEALRNNGDEVMIFAPSGGPAEIFGAEVVGMPAMAFPLYPELRLALPRTSMGRKLDRFKPDVVHLLEPVLLGIGGIYYADQLRIPLVVSYHTNLPAYLNYYRLGVIEPLTWKLMQWRHGRANLNLCTSTAMLDDLRSHGIEHLALWDWSVDAERFRPREFAPAAACSPSRSLLSGGEPYKPLLLYVGRLSAEKDVIRLKELFAAIPGMRLAIVGDGPLRKQLEREFKDTATVFTGYLEGDDLANAYSAADLFLLPSQTETLGLVLLEAMAAGCPVIACRAGGVPDAVLDGVTGFLFEPNDPTSLITTAQRALNGRKQLQSIRENARNEVAAHSWARATEKLTLLYRQTIEKTQRDGLKEKTREVKPLPRRIAANIARGTLRTLLP